MTSLLVRVLRWFRFKRLSKGFRRWEIHASLNSAIFQIVKLAVVVLWCTHVLGMTLVAACRERVPIDRSIRLVEEDEEEKELPNVTPSPVFRFRGLWWQRPACGFYAVAIMEGEEASWLAAVDVRGGTLFDRYVLSYYWAITTVGLPLRGWRAPVWLRESSAV